MNFQKTSGIYQIRQISTGKLYIGSSINLAQREKDHFNSLRRNGHDNPKLQNSFNKYGASDFSFEVLVTCPKTQIIKLEQSFLDGYKPFFNINPTAGNCTGRKFSEETKKKMSEIKKGKPLNPALIARQQKKLPTKDGFKWCSTCNKFHIPSKVQKHRALCKSCYAEFNKRSRAIPGRRWEFAKSNGKKVLAVKDGIQISFFSMRDAAKFVGGKCSKTGITLAIKMNKLYYGFEWSFI